MNASTNFVIAMERSDLNEPLGQPGEGFSIESVAPLPSTPGGGLGPANFIEPVSVIVAASIATLAFRLVEHCLTRREKGIQIDARTTPATVSTIAGIPAGFLVLIAADGSVTTHPAASLTSAGLATLLGSVVSNPKNG
jgi:hypothetical protein